MCCCNAISIQGDLRMDDMLPMSLKSTLVSRNITVSGKRTSIRLEPEMWKSLKDIAQREACSIHDLCSLIGLRKNKRTSLTAAIRVFLMLYFKASSTEDGHQRAGHGNFENMKIRAGVVSAWSFDPKRQDQQKPQTIRSLRDIPQAVPQGLQAIR